VTGRSPPTTRAAGELADAEAVADGAVADGATAGAGVADVGGFDNGELEHAPTRRAAHATTRTRRRLIDRMMDPCPDCRGA